MSSATIMHSPSNIKSEKARPQANLLPLHSGDLRQRELARAEAAWKKAESFRFILVFIYVAAFLCLFQFLMGTTFASAILDEIKAAQLSQAFP